MKKLVVLWVILGFVTGIAFGGLFKRRLHTVHSEDFKLFFVNEPPKLEPGQKIELIVISDEMEGAENRLQSQLEGRNLRVLKVAIDIVEEEEIEESITPP